jgi:hypothetical protein
MSRVLRQVSEVVDLRRAVTTSVSAFGVPLVRHGRSRKKLRRILRAVLLLVVASIRLRKGVVILSRDETLRAWEAFIYYGAEESHGKTREALASLGVVADDGDMVQLLTHERVVFRDFTTLIQRQKRRFVKGAPVDEAVELFHMLEDETGAAVAEGRLRDMLAEFGLGAEARHMVEAGDTNQTGFADFIGDPTSGSGLGSDVWLHADDDFAAEAAITPLLPLPPLDDHALLRQMMAREDFGSFTNKGGLRSAARRVSAIAMFSHGAVPATPSRHGARPVTPSRVSNTSASPTASMSPRNASPHGMESSMDVLLMDSMRGVVPSSGADSLLLPQQDERAGPMNGLALDAAAAPPEAKLRRPMSCTLSRRQTDAFVQRMAADNCSRTQRRATSAQGRRSPATFEVPPPSCNICLALPPRAMPWRSGRTVLEGAASGVASSRRPFDSRPPSASSTSSRPMRAAVPVVRRPFSAKGPPPAAAVAPCTTVSVPKESVPQLSRWVAGGRYASASSHHATVLRLRKQR